MAEATLTTSLTRFVFSCPFYIAQNKCVESCRRNYFSPEELRQHADTFVNSDWAISFTNDIITNGLSKRRVPMRMPRTVMPVVKDYHEVTEVRKIHDVNIILNTEEFDREDSIITDNNHTLKRKLIKSTAGMAPRRELCTNAERRSSPLKVNKNKSQESKVNCVNFK
jgi:hypothetical protein